MSNLPRILSLGPRPTGNDPLSIILGQLWDAEVEALVLPRLQQEARQQPPEGQAPTYDRRKLTQRGMID
jgi:hypothetical protein